MFRSAQGDYSGVLLAKARAASEGGQVKQGEQEFLHARDNVGQTSGTHASCLNPGFSENWEFSRSEALGLDS
jgi:hypothetical protein